ncbi:MAG TPA: ATP-dependent zinc metalloprotease FtsH [Candidatus Limivivens intestinipullorum]|uniref:ATP-dependent zinc metalloprotease FtsH n=1 Tax=Candidatus Limivivens intestinipullorum TaxID=2840858 RepID=A0A9D1EVW9_9FIRM|nr:ATP-dependent zinc metalloprotease FtsH [Candidatus Limivivens intestinipullorum]
MDNNQLPNGGPGNQNNNGGRPPKNGQTIVIFLVVSLIALMVINFFNGMFRDSTRREISYNDFIEMVENGEVASVTIYSNEIQITPVSQPFPGVSITYYTGVVDDPNLADRLLAAGVEFNQDVPDMTSALVYNIAATFLPLILVWVLLWFFMRRMSKGGGMMGVGKSKARVYDSQKETGVTFKDVAGQDEAKESLQEVVDFLENPGKYSSIGAKLPKGALLVGPPGTGKTLLAKAVAGEAKCPFFSISGSGFVEMFVGVGASRVRDLFEEAKKSAPCIVFIDEIDAIGKTRDSGYGGGNDEREQTLNQLLAEMDGFDTSSGLLILAATNRPEVLDPALLRPGRFDRRVIVDKPDLKGRVDILKVHAKNVSLDDTVDFEAIALATSGAVGSDLANMVNEAAILAVKKGRKAVSQADLFEAVEVVLVGKEKKNKILSAEERRIVSYHEVGHALVSALQKHSEPVQKITIVPRTMGALGYVMNVPEEEKFLNSEEEIRARLVEFVAGRAAEELVFHSVTTGAANDIEQATRIARAMITQYGMSEKFGMMGLEVAANQYLDNRTILNCSDETAAEVDREIQKILKESYDKALRLLSEHRKALDEIAAYLIEKETITGKEFMEIFHRVENTKAEESGEKDASAEIQPGGEKSALAGEKFVEEKAVTAETQSGEEKLAPAGMQPGEGKPVPAGEPVGEARSESSGAQPGEEKSAPAEPVSGDVPEEEPIEFPWDSFMKQSSQAPYADKTEEK